jgi:hypothetical protein
MAVPFSEATGATFCSFFSPSWIRSRKRRCLGKGGRSVLEFFCWILVLQPASQGTLFRPEGPIFGGFTDLLFYPAFQVLPDRGLQAETIQILMNLFPEETELKGLEIEFPDSEEAFIQGPKKETVFLPGGLDTREAAD